MSNVETARAISARAKTIGLPASRASFFASSSRRPSIVRAIFRSASRRAWLGIARTASNARLESTTARSARASSASSISPSTSPPQGARTGVMRGTMPESRASTMHPYADVRPPRARSPRATSAASTARVAKDWDARRGARLPRVPRRLRHRDEPPRLQDPLQDPERRSAHARRALLRAVGRHGGASSARASCRSCRSRARGRCATSTSSASRSSSSSPTRTSSRCSTSAASRCARRDRGEDDPLVIAGGPTATHPEPLARVHRRRSSSATARSARPRSRSPGRELQERRASRAPSACVALAKLARRLRAVALRDDASIPTPASRSSTAPLVPEAAAARRARARRRSERVPVPRRRPGRRARGDLRSHVDRDRARLHRGLPLLPGRHDLPPRARARSASRSSRRSLRAVKKCGLRRGRASPSLSTADYSCIAPLIKKVAEQPRAGEGLARRLVAARLRPRARTCSTTSSSVRATRPHVRARGRQPAHARRGQQERHRRAAHDDGRARLLARLGRA